MKSTLPLTLVVTIALAACKPAQPPAAQTPPPADTAATADARAPSSSAPATTPMPDVGNTAPASATDPTQQASLSGYGDMKLGSSIEEAKKGWGGELKELGTPVPDAKKDPQGCYYLVPQWAKDSTALAFMIEAGKFVRYESASDKEIAPGGGKVGMTADQLKTLYPNLEAAPHKYEEGAQYLSTTTSGASPTKLVFEVDAAGKVTEWRVGLLPQADYVEGCS